MFKRYFTIALFLLSHATWATEVQVNKEECDGTAKLLKRYLEQHQNGSEQEPNNTVLDFPTTSENQTFPAILNYQKACNKVTTNYLKLWVSFFAVSIENILQEYDALSTTTIMMSRERNLLITEISELVNIFKTSPSEGNRQKALTALLNFYQVRTMHTRHVLNVEMDMSIANDFTKKVIDVLNNLREPNGPDTFVYPKEWNFLGFENQEEAFNMSEFLSGLIRRFPDEESELRTYLKSYLQLIDSDEQKVREIAATISKV